MKSKYIIGDDYKDPMHGCLAYIIGILVTVVLCICI